MYRSAMWLRRSAGEETWSESFSPTSGGSAERRGDGARGTALGAQQRADHGRNHDAARRHRAAAVCAEARQFDMPPKQRRPQARSAPPGGPIRDVVEESEREIIDLAVQNKFLEFQIEAKERGAHGVAAVGDPRRS